MKPIRVMIVEDSPTVRELLCHIIKGDPQFEIVAIAESGEKALTLLSEAKPDVISMDIRLPGINGFETTRKIMEIQPTPIVVVSASVEAEDLHISMNALRAGALSVIEKPLSITNQAYEKISRQLLNQLKIMSEVRVVRQRLPRKIDTPISKSGSDAFGTTIVRECRPGSYKMLGLVASTGGPHALCEVLSRLPKDFPLPILIVQHITSSFLEGFVQWLDSILDFTVVMVRSKTMPVPGSVYLAAPDCHLVVDDGYLIPDSGPEVNYQRPSGTITFNSMANYYKAQCIGVLLTGMGEDGAKGLLEIKKAGGFTIVEDESTSVVYGMPGAAYSMGAACESLPLYSIGQAINNLTIRS